MNISVFGSGGGTLPSGWSKESAIAIFGGCELDGSAGADPRASLTFVGLFGGLELKVPPGSRVSQSGFALFGERKVDVVSQDGPEILVKSYVLFGGVDVREGRPIT
jgi:hypothetical protein